MNETAVKMVLEGSK
jgi:DDE superfamily endonuclease